MINKYRPYVGSYEFKLIYDKKNKRVLIKRKYLNPNEHNIECFLADVILTESNINNKDMQEILSNLNNITYLKIIETIKKERKEIE